jgi:MraZ protein
VFKGTYHHRIDAKGRLPVPAAFRRALGDEPGQVVVTLLDQCLAAYSPAEWSRLEAQLAALPAFSRPVKALTRLLASRAADCEIDVQGRILLPPALRAAAGLARDAVVVGVLNRFEVWSPENWDAFVRESERLLADVSLDIQWPLPPTAPSGPVLAPPKPPSGSGDPQAKPNG